MTTDPLSTTLSALADPTRRAILARLTSGERTVTDLAQPFNMTLPAVTKHLKVLEKAGLIERRRDAQKRPCRLQAAPLEEVSAWVEDYRQSWEESLDRLGGYLQGLQSTGTEHAGSRKTNAENELVFTRIYDAPRALVFDAWTDPKRIGKWWGPKDFTTTTKVMEVKVGGRWEYIMHGPDGADYPNKSVYIEVEKPRRLVFSNTGGKADDPHLTCQMCVTFEEIGGKTKLTLRMIFPSTDAVSRAKKYGAETGGYETLGRLAAFMREDEIETRNRQARKPL